MVDKYSKPSISGYNSSPPPDDDSDTAANAISWSGIKTKLADPIKTLLDAVNTATDTLADSLFGNAVRADSAGGTITTSDYGKLIKTSNAITVTVLTGGDAGSNFVFAFYNSDSTNNLTIARNGNNINGAASNITIEPGKGGIAFCDGTDWWILKTTLTGSDSSLSLESTDAGATVAPNLDLYRNSASPAASDILGTLNFYGEDSAGNKQLYGRVYSFLEDPTSTSEDGRIRVESIVAGSAVLSAEFHNGQILGSPTGSFKGDGTLNAASGLYDNNSRVTPLISGAVTATTSGTSHDYTSIPSYVKKITITFDRVSTNGTSIPLIQIGDSGGIETTSYNNMSGFTQDAAATSVGAVGTTGFALTSTVAANTHQIVGIATLALVDSATFTWAFNFLGADFANSRMLFGAGTKALSATLDRVRLTTVNGTDTFDNGSFNIMYE